MRKCKQHILVASECVNKNVKHVARIKNNTTAHIGEKSCYYLDICLEIRFVLFSTIKMKLQNHIHLKNLVLFIINLYPFIIYLFLYLHYFTLYLYS